MNLRSTSLLFLWTIFSIFSIAKAQNDDIPPPVWTVKIAPSASVKVGDVVTLEFHAKIKEGLHIYTVEPLPAGQTGYLPTTIEFEDVNGQYETVGKFGERGKRITEFDDIFEVNVHYFKNEVVYFQKIKILKPNPKVTGVVRCQVCSDSRCLPFQKEFNELIKAEGAAITSNPTPETQTVEPKALGDSTNKDTDQTTNSTPLPTSFLPPCERATANDTANAGSGCDLWFIFITAFGGGLLALLTPCVFPLIPMTVSFFTKRASSRSKGIKDAIIYSLSIILTITLVGSALVLAFGSTVLNDIATNVYINLLFFALLLVFGLSFLGMFELTLPSSWSTKFDQMSERGGVLGIFFMAMTLVVASFSCTGPIMGAFLPLLEGGNLLCPLVGMFGFSIGFAVPFTLFALFPGWLNSLPKSGGWMNSVKVVLGFIEIALALKFLSNADLQEDWHLLDREIFIAIWIAIAGLMGYYLLGRFRLPHDTPIEKIPVPRFLLALASFSFVLYLLPGLWGAPLAQLSGLLPPNNYDIGVRLAPVHGQASGGGKIQAGGEVCQLPRKYDDLFAEHTPDGFCTFFDLDEALVYAQKVNKPVFLDFTGVNCANCREVERFVWSDPRIKEKLTKDYVMVSLFTDKGEKLPEKVTMPDGTVIRTLGDKWKYFQKNCYGQASQPYYALVTPDMKSLGDGLAYTRDKELYLKFLNDGLNQYKAVRK